MKGEEKKKGNGLTEYWEGTQQGEGSHEDSGKGHLQILTFLEQPINRKTEHHFLKGKNKNPGLSRSFRIVLPMTRILGLPEGESGYSLSGHIGLPHRS